MDTKRYVGVVSLLILAALVTLVANRWEIKPQSDAGFFDFPKDLAGYTSKDVFLKDRVYEILETKNVIMREYVKGNEPPILFYFIFAQETYKTSDPPENCLRGEGRSIVDKSRKTLEINTKTRKLNLEVNKLSVGKAEDKQIYLYWFLVGNEFTDSYVKQRLKLFLGYLNRKPLSGGQVRISTQVIGDKEEEALKRLKDFISEILPHLLKFIS